MERKTASEAIQWRMVEMEIRRRGEFYSSVMLVVENGFNGSFNPLYLCFPLVELYVTNL